MSGEIMFKAIDYSNKILKQATPTECKNILVVKIVSRQNGEILIETK